MTEMNLKEKVTAIQTELKAPKNQYNNFGRFAYRNVEDIIEALKPLTKKYKVTVTMEDEIEIIEDYIFLKSTVFVADHDSDKEISRKAFARMEESKKGMDSAQWTGAVSSYARKYALNAMFMIDDTKDVDHYNNTEPKKPAQPRQQAPQVQERGKIERIQNGIKMLATDTNQNIGDIVNNILATHNVANLEQLNESQQEKVISYLMAEIKKARATI